MLSRLRYHAYQSGRRAATESHIRDVGSLGVRCHLMVFDDKSQVGNVFDYCQRRQSQARGDVNDVDPREFGCIMIRLFLCDS